MVGMLFGRDEGDLRAAGLQQSPRLVGVQDRRSGDRALPPVQRRSDVGHLLSDVVELHIHQDTRYIPEVDQ